MATRTETEIDLESLLTSRHSVVREGVVARSSSSVSESGSQEGNVLSLMLANLNDALKNVNEGERRSVWSFDFGREWSRGDLEENTDLSDPSRVASSGESSLVELAESLPEKKGKQKGEEEKIGSAR